MGPTKMPQLRLTTCSLCEVTCQMCGWGGRSGWGGKALCIGRDIWGGQDIWGGHGSHEGAAVEIDDKQVAPGHFPGVRMGRLRQLGLVFQQLSLTCSRVQQRS